MSKAGVFCFGGFLFSIEIELLIVKKYKMKKLLLSAILLFICCVMYGQELPQIISPSPKASTLGIYAEIPVSYSTGVPQIEIPIWDIKVGGFSLPISLSYHASGIKVSQEASEVGLGWALNAGGVITRTVYGKEDFGYRLGKQDQYPVRDRMPPAYLADKYLPYPSNSYFFDPGWEVSVDMQPDLFHFNFNGRSGKFMLKQDGEAVIFPHQELKITYHTPLGLTIIDEKGVKYTFNERERITSVREHKGYLLPNGSIPVNRSSHFSAFYLSEIELVNKQKITFNYLPEKYQTTSPKQTTQYYNSVTMKKEIHYDTTVYTEVEGSYLSSIEWNLGKIEFETTERIDLLDAGSDYPQRISQIKIIDKTLPTTALKTFKLNHGYFNEPVNPPYVATAKTAENTRLKLNSITEYNAENDAKPPYVFSYDESSLPSKVKGSRDHWGYQRGGNGFNTPTLSNSPIAGTNYFGNSIVANIRVTTGAETPLPYYINYQNRSPHFPEMQAGTLIGIQYPTGGTTEFEYEPHFFSKYEAIYKRSFYESVSLKSATAKISGSSTNSQVQKTISSENPLLFSFYIDGEVNDCFDFSCYGDPCLRLAECSGKYRGNRIFVTDLSNDKIVLSIGFNDPWDIGEDSIYGFFGAHSLITDLGLNTSSNDVSKKYLILPPGAYRLTTQRGNNTAMIEGSLDSYDVVIKPYNGNTKVMAGGLRIKRKTNFDFDKKAKETRYEYSKGILYDKPSYYDYTIEYEKGVGLSCGEPATNPRFLNDISIKRRLLTTNTGVSNSLTASHIAYQNVKIKETPVKNYESGGFSTHIFRPRKVYKKNNGNPVDTNLGVVYSPCTDCGEGGESINCVQNQSSLLGPHFNLNLLPDYNLFPQMYESSSILDSVNYFSDSGQLLKTESYDYEFVNKENVKGFSMRSFFVEPDVLGSTCGQARVNGRCYSLCCTFFDLRYSESKWYDITNGYNRLTSKKTTSYFETGNIEQNEIYTYEGNNHIYPTKTEVSISGETTILNEFQYPPDLAGDPIMDNLIQSNRINTPVVTKSFKIDENETTKLSEFKTAYLEFPLKDDQNNITNVPLLKHIYQKKGTGTIDDATDKRISYHSYDEKGNVTEVSKANGTHTYYIWGYQGVYPIAKIENFTTAQALNLQTAINAAITASNNDDDNCLSSENCNEKILLTALETLRNLLPTNTQMSSYTYNPLVGVTSVTNSRREIIYYYYDAFNRLEFVKDQNGHVLSKNKYYYKNN